MKILAWSGPRNLSTAMMYAFGNRPDFEVMDEPFYAAYLAATGLDHPMRDAILASQPTDPAAVATLCRKPPKIHSYQKHMAHHMLPDFPLDWTEGAVHLHLIRHPARVIASYGAKRDDISASEGLSSTPRTSGKTRRRCWQSSVPKWEFPSIPLC
jgi:hypothetical protein